MFMKKQEFFQKFLKLFTIKKLQIKLIFDRYFACLRGIVWLFVSNERKNGWTDWAQIICGTLHGPKELRFMTGQQS